MALIFAQSAIAGVIVARQRYALNSFPVRFDLRRMGRGLVATVQGGWGLRGVAVHLPRPSKSSPL